ncbi:hypothetical protein A3F27_02205 [Candidatus Kaiserbacteria bacterium RIFCSPHIGHO2_12_FULL_53_13]|uniref:Methyltransferase type 11 domain-containing protein n=1 Tax=Candidatus Kaiserbacteria bacterium RIFCSPHIGHO2_12_FULL_53_13 TaxID=1798502 RepID=A0A1F6EBS3_9BACT|nr:MAG: hypothetical protein A3F27_02205 [Candidatus Kaiserbacteria bacterium RIFCSPHIGHO2_12_FULL_53_13]OGG74700.1 MAG: hypothetical protein A3A37_02445 [Candidatus Kaiserbacteria bacterium RIFCSPLOWO2_01_FULL_52_36]
MNGTTQAYFNKWLKNPPTGGTFLNARVYTTIDRFLQHAAKRGFAGNMLDIGCGDGSFVSYCKEKGLDAHGIDIGDGVDFETDTLPFKDNSFDFALMNSVIEHLKDPANILKETKRVLSHDGILIVITPNLDTVKFGFWDDPTHVRPYNPRNIVWMMNMFDFEKIRVGLWTVGKSSSLWDLPEDWQFQIGRFLPFTGLNKYAPGFLKGKSTTMLCALRVRK